MHKINVLSLSLLTFVAMVLNATPMPFGKGVLLFKTYFEEGVTSYTSGTGGEILGEDISGYKWPDDLPFTKKKCGLNFIGETPEYANAVIRPGIGRNGSRGFYAEVHRDDPNTPARTRAQYEIPLKADQANNRRYFRFWMKMDPDWPNLPYEKSIWRMFWEMHDFSESGFRLNAQAHREGNAWVWSLRGVGPNSTPVWEVRSDPKAPEAPQFGEWQLFELFYNIGEDGRFLLAVDDQIQCDYQGDTRHPKHPKAHLTKLQILKVYGQHSGKRWTIFDDFEIWSDLPPRYLGQNE